MNFSICKIINLLFYDCKDVWICFIRGYRGSQQFGVTECVDVRWPWWLFDFSVRREQWKHFNPTNSFYPEKYLELFIRIVMIVRGGPMTWSPTVHWAGVLSSYLLRSPPATLTTSSSYNRSTWCWRKSCNLFDFCTTPVIWLNLVQSCSKVN